MVYSKELKNNYYKCHCHCLIIDGISYSLLISYMSNSSREIPINKKKSLMEVHTVFLFVICHIHRWKYWRNEAGNFVFWGTFVGSKFITDRPQITDESFYDKVFSSVSLSVKFVPTDWENKYQQKNSDSKFKIFGSAGHNLLIKNNSLNKSLMNW